MIIKEGMDFVTANDVLNIIDRYDKDADIVIMYRGKITNWSRIKINSAHLVYSFFKKEYEFNCLLERNCDIN